MFLRRLLQPSRRDEQVAFSRPTHAARLALLTGRPYALTSDAWEHEPTFGFDFLADSIAKVILETDPQLTLAVYGKWGTGKTTLLHAIEERIASPDCAVAWFDMWEYKNQQNVVAHLLDAIGRALPRGSAASDGILRLARAALASATITTGAVSFSGKDFLGELGALWEEPRVETESLRASLDAWRHGRGPAARVVVIVDNLDRCGESQSVGLLEQITSLFGFPGVVFLLAAEKERLATAVERRHRLPGGEGTVYLEKIVQVEFRVPGLEEEHLVAWTRGLAKDPLVLGDDDARLLALVAGWNPRQIKRLLNNVRIQLCTARGDAEADSGLSLASTLLLHRDHEVWSALTASEETRRQVAALLDGAE